MQTVLELHDEREVLLDVFAPGGFRVDETREDIVENRVLTSSEHHDWFVYWSEAAHALTPHKLQIVCSTPSARTIVLTRCS